MENRAVLPNSKHERDDDCRGKSRRSQIARCISTSAKSRSTKISRTSNALSLNIAVSLQAFCCC